MPDDTVNPSQRQICKRADIEVDHGEFLVVREIGRRAKQSEAGIIHHNRRLKAGVTQCLRQSRWCIARKEIGGDYLRARVAAGGNLGGQ
jgi:hypothetical protein